jgi:hypothetical protein
MLEKIIVLLGAKFKGARKDTLAQIARALAMQATTEEQAQALVDVITDEQVTDFEREFRASVDKQVTDGVKKNENTLKEKFDFVEKKKQAPANPELKPEDNDTPAWAKAIIENNKRLADELAVVKAGEAGKLRKQAVEKAIEGAGDKTKAKLLRDFALINFENDEAFDAYMEDTKAYVADVAQDDADKGLGQTASPMLGNGAPVKGPSKAEMAEMDKIT